NFTNKLKYGAVVLAETLGPALTRGIDLFQDMGRSLLDLFGVFDSDKSVEDWAWQLEEYLILAYNAFDEFVADLINFFTDMQLLYKENKTAFEAFGLAFGTVITVTMIPTVKSAISALGLWAKAAYATAAANLTILAPY